MVCSIFGPSCEPAVNVKWPTRFANTFSTWESRCAPLRRAPGGCGRDEAPGERRGRNDRGRSGPWIVRGAHRILRAEMTMTDLEVFRREKGGFFGPAPLI